MLAAVPDFRPTLKTASFEELADLLEAFDVTAVYDKAERTLVLGATVTPELVPDNEQPRRSGALSGISSIAGERFAPVSDSAVRVEMVAANRVYGRSWSLATASAGAYLRSTHSVGDWLR